jgi:HNH endonuclease
MADDPMPSRSEIHVVATSEPRRGQWRWFPPATQAELWTGLVFIILPLFGAAWVIHCRSEALALERDSITVEHILPKKHGGTDDPRTLAWSCHYCNLCKSST